MSFSKEVNAAKIILACIEKEGPRDRDGVLLSPYKKWALALSDQVNQAEEWIANTSNAKEVNRANDQGNRPDKDSAIGSQAGN